MEERSEEQNKEQKTESKKVKIDREKPRRKTKTESETISFDAYFRIMMNKDSAVRPHHKAPMKSFVASQLGKEEATKEEFEKVLRRY